MTLRQPASSPPRAGCPEFAAGHGLTTATLNDDLVHTFNNEVTATASDNLRFKGDFSGGQSGGPIYYCPDGDDTVCGSGDLGFVVAVAAGFSGYYNRVMGPRASNFRSWAIGIMP
ncbi:MAG: hypothetical protein H0V89_11290 [Deltaproteobacteria bacterium]|nr:hypothetical protein [Deltaproteobacteria bacterium]